jgi:hypothetical protein
MQGKWVNDIWEDLMKWVDSTMENTTQHSVSALPQFRDSCVQERLPVRKRLGTNFDRWYTKQPTSDNDTTALLSCIINFEGSLSSRV